MIKNDFRYIVKRIIIGIGICLGLSFLSGCSSVYAYELNPDELIVEGMGTGSTYCRVYYSLNDNKIYYYGRTSNNANWNQLLNLTYDPSHNYVFIGMNKKETYQQHVACEIYDFNSDIYLDYVTTNNISRYSIMYENEGTYTYFVGNSNMSNITTNVRNYQGIINGKKVVISNGGNTIYNETSTIQNKTQVINKPIFDKSINDYVFQNKVNSIFPLSLSSTIEDLGIQRNFDDNNILSSVTFNPTFDNFDTDYFTYQYKIGNNNWLTITANNVTFNVNQNTSVYFRILKNSDNSVVDSRVYTITQIGFYETNPTDYKVVYTSENKSVDSSESSPSRTIDRVTINFEYFPKISNLKYQYQYVEEGSSLSDWIDMPSDDYERGYTTLVNGTLYNRILDSDDNVLYTSTFNVNSIGKLMIDDNVSWYSSLFKKIDYGSGIGSIFFLPVRLIESIQSNFNNSCQSYNLGSLLGTDLIIPCINIKSHIGSTLYNTIDLIFMGFIILSLIKFITSLYNRIVSLNFTGNDDGEGVLFL